MAFFLLLLSLALLARGQTIPPTYNWATTGTFANSSSTCAFPILNQQQCGGCYAFSTAATLGVSLCAATGNAAWLGFSPQEVLNTNYQDQSPSTWNNNNNPCNGGLPSVMMYFLAQEAQEGAGFGMCSAAPPSSDDSSCNGGACEACAAGCLPYTEGNCVEDSDEPIDTQFSESSCTNDACVCNPFSPATSCASTSLSPLSLPSGLSFSYQAFSGSDFLSASGQAQLQQWLMTRGPVSIAMDAGDTFSASGAAAAECSDCAGQVNHAVTIMGWATVAGAPSWIIQNSWGTQWGDSGFFYVPMSSVGTSPGQFNLCLPTGLAVSSGNGSGGGGASTVPPAAQHTTAPATEPPASSTVGDSHYYNHDSHGGSDDDDPVFGGSLALSTTSRFGPLPADLRQQLGGLYFPPGARVPVANHDSHHVKALLAYVLHHVDARLAMPHNLTAIERVHRQVVNGILYSSTLLVTDTLTSHTRRIHSAVLAHPSASAVPGNLTLHVLSLHISHPLSLAAVGAGSGSSSSPSPSSSSSSPTRLGLGLGLGLGLACAVALAGAAMVVVVRHQRAARTAQAQKASELQQELLRNWDEL